jgi:ribose transport system substrate-binding protein
VTYVDGDGKLGESFEAIRRHLRVSKARRLLVGAINDPSALGALRAFQEAGRSDSCAVMGQNAAPEGRAELRQPGTRLIGSVAYFPEKYGAEILALGPRHPAPPPGAAGDLRQAPAGHAGERRSHLSERPAAPAVGRF